MTQILDGLNYAHENQVVHRDIKPANIIVLASGVVKIADFGIAHVDHSEITQTGAVIGTPGYMSPEQVKGEKITARSDLFSTGAVLYQMLMGEKPFKGNQTSVMQQILFEEPEPLTNFSDDLLDDLQHVVGRSLAKEPAERYQTAALFSRELRQCSVPGSSAHSSSTAGLQDTVDPRINIPANEMGPDSTFSGSTDDWDREILEKIEKMLMPIVGPLARVLIKRSLPGAEGDFQLLGDLIAGKLDNGEDRQRFLTAFGSLADTIQSPSKSTARNQQTTAKPDKTIPPPGWDPALLDLASKLLANHIGPMARILVQKYARKTLEIDELLRMLTVHITHENEQNVFVVSWQQNMGRILEKHDD